MSIFGNNDAAAILAHAERELATERQRYDDLLTKYHELRATHDAPPKYDMVTAAEQFGPLTRLALSDMARGQSGLVVRTMRDKALAIWLENRGQDNQDEVTAITVRNGEPL